MLRPQRHRLVTLGLLAAYVVASTFSGALHGHADAACQSAQVCQGAHADQHADHSHASDEHEHHDGIATLEAADEAGHEHHDDCSICRFVGQRVLRPQAVELTAWSLLAVEVSSQQVAAPIVCSARTPHSRAPPLVG